MSSPESYLRNMEPVTVEDYAYSLTKPETITQNGGTKTQYASTETGMLHLAEEHTEPGTTVDWQSNSYTRIHENESVPLDREALIFTESDAIYYLRNNSIFKIIHTDTRDSVELVGNTFDKDHPIPQTALGSTWKINDSETSPRVSGIIIGISQVTGDRDTKAAIGYAKRAGDPFGLAEKLTAKISAAPERPKFTYTKPPETDPEAVLRRFEEVSDDPTGSELEDYLTPEEAAACRVFLANARRLNNPKTPPELLGLRKRRRGDKPVWENPQERFNRTGSWASSILYETVWQGRGYKIGTLDLERGSKHTFVMLCDDGKLRCFRNPIALSRSYGEGYGKLPENGTVTITTPISTKYEPLKLLRSLFDKYLKEEEPQILRPRRTR